MERDPERPRTLLGHALAFNLGLLRLSGGEPELLRVPLDYLHLQSRSPTKLQYGVWLSAKACLLAS